MALLDRFLRYVKIDTQSDEDSTLTPSTMKQYDLLNVLKEELSELGVESELDKYGRLWAFLDGNKAYDRVGMCAHVDTALEITGKDVKPQVIRNYDGNPIRLGKTDYYLTREEFPKLNELLGKTLVTTSGDTLLGADDKAGLAIIMDALEKYLKIPVNNRRPLSILFTPDEEIGRGPEHFDSKKYRAKYAYTFDGGDPKYIAIENFNAKSARIIIEGKSIHPGSAYGIMVNASEVLSHYISLINKDMVPSKTKHREGFNHLCAISGNVEHAEAHYILRNHDKDILKEQEFNFIHAKEQTLKEFPNAKIDLEIKEQYRNMIEVLNEHPEAKDRIEEVYNSLGIKFSYEPIRGGTDGATFSFLGTPCPNLGTGSYNHHGRFEFACLEEMELMVQIALKILAF